MPSPAPRRTRLRSTLSLFTVAGLAATGAAAIAVTGAAPATAAPASPVATCPADGHAPPLGHFPLFTDTGVAVYAGGDYTVTGAAAESEGLLLVAGDASFAKTSGGVFNVGTAGYGSGIVPPAGGQMLAVGGDLTTSNGTSVHVGANLAGGGAVDVGGSAAGASIDSFGGPVRSSLGAATATSPNTGFGSLIESTSAALAATADTDDVTTSGNTVRFASTTERDLYVFSIAASTLGTKPEVVFDLASDAPVLVNVTGASLTWAPNFFADDAGRFDGPSGANFGEWSSRILWNLDEATSVTLGTNGQLIGSVLAPVADADVSTSTNGRLLVGGDLTVSGSGVEHHNYPWSGGEGLECSPEPTTPEEVVPPVDPETPTTPLTPVEPGTPVSPETPEEPATPGESNVTPEQPGTPAGSTTETSAAGAEKADLASTGFEATGIAVLAAALLAGAGALLAIARRRRRA
ncbi:choice-of-anchor A family protein [Agromyces sp. PvR057]|uniref:choice-of-anchor A family protein n=1 Tax=Agromyces sp. PvR057 TaxID=3156403 RepID=UPI00339771A7